MQPISAPGALQCRDAALIKDSDQKMVQLRGVSTVFILQIGNKMERTRKSTIQIVIFYLGLFFVNKSIFWGRG